MNENDYKEDLQEIAEIIDSLYTEEGGTKLPSHLASFSSQISLIQRIATGKHREQLKRMQAKLNK